MLIIIDMQLKFSAAGDVVPQVCEAIKEAIKNKEEIVLVEYDCHRHKGRNPDCDLDCQTYSQILELLEGYDKLTVIIKNEDGGAKHIMEQVSMFPPIVNICGVNIDACVAATVQGLARLNPNSEFVLIEEACSDSWKSGRLWGWLGNYQNVRKVQNISRV